MIQQNLVPGAPAFGEALGFDDYLHACWRLKWQIVAAGITGLAVSAILIQFFPSQFTSRALVRFIPPKVNEKYVSSNGDAWAQQRTAVLAQTLTSTLTARKMVEGAKLYPEFRRFLPSADLVSRFQSGLSVRPIIARDAGGSRTAASLEISFSYADPAVAKQVVQQLVESVYESNERHRADQSMGTAQFLAEQTEAARERLDELEVELGQMGRPDRIAGDHEWALKIQNLYSVENRLGHVQSSLRSLKKQLTESLEEIMAVEAQLKRVPSGITSSSEPRTQEAVRLRWEANAAQVNVELLAKRYKPDHPELLDAIGMLEQLQRQYEIQVERDVEAARMRARRQIQNQLDLLRGQRDSLSAAIRTQEAEEIQLTRKASELRAAAYSNSESDADYLRLMREYSSTGEHFRALFKKERESQLAAEVDRLGQGEMVELLDPPTVPTQPEFPSSQAKLAIGFFIGIAAGFMLSILRFQMRPTLRTGRHLLFWQGAVLLADLPAGSIEDGGRWRESGLGRWIPRLTGISNVLTIWLAVTAIFLAGCRHDTASQRDAWIHAGLNAEKSGNIDKAIRCYQLAIRADARSGTAHAGMARAQLAIGDVEASLAHLIRSAELRPQDSVIQVQLAGMLYRIYHSEPGRSSATLRELEEQAKRLMAQWPAMADGYRVMSLVLCERGRPAEAAELLEEGIRNTGANPSMTVELASVIYRLGQRERSEELLRSVIGSDARYPQAYDLLYLQLRDRQKAEEAGDILQAKWTAIGDADSGMQYAAHLGSLGRRDAMLAHVDAVDRKLANQAEAAFVLGSFLVSRGENDRAKRVYERAMVSFPSRRGEFIGRLSEIAAAHGRRDQAVAAIDAALKGNSSDLSLQAHKAALELDSDQPERAQAAKLQLELLLKRMPSSAFVRFHLGRSYVKFGDLFKANDQFTRCIHIDPNYAPGWLALAESEYRGGNLARSRATVDRLLAGAPMYAPALLLKARVEGDLGKPKEMKESLDLAVIAGAPSHEVAVVRARLLISSGDVDEALRILRAAAASHRDPAISLALAEAEASRGEFRLALAALDAGAEANPGVTDIPLAKATLLLKGGRHLDALGLFKSLREKAPESPAVAAGFADALAMTGQLKEAVVAYEAAMKLPGSAASVWVSAGAVYNALGDVASARRCYQEALARDGTNPYALNNLAYLLGRSGENLEFALQLAQSADSVFPQSEEVQDTLVYVTLRMGLKQQALEVLDRAAARSKEPAKGWFRSLRAELARGTTDQVLRRLEEAQRGRKLS